MTLFTLNLIESEQVGQPLMVTVDESSHVAAFKDFIASESSPVIPSAASNVIPSPHIDKPSSNVQAISTSTQLSAERIFASPFARKIAKEKFIDLSSVFATGPNGRVVAADVLSQINKSKDPNEIKRPVASTQIIPETSIPHEDLSTGVADRELAGLLTHSKKVVPHYYLSVDVNISKVLQLREELSEKYKGGISLLDIIVKAAAMAVKQVPDVNASWLESFVRRYDQVSCFNAVYLPSDLMRSRLI